MLKFNIEDFNKDQNRDVVIYVCAFINPKRQKEQHVTLGLPFQNPNDYVTYMYVDKIPYDQLDTQVYYSETMGSFISESIIQFIANNVKLYNFTYKKNVHIHLEYIGKFNTVSTISSVEQLLNKYFHTHESFKKGMFKKVFIGTQYSISKAPIADIAVDSIVHPFTPKTKICDQKVLDNTLFDADIAKNIIYNKYNTQPRLERMEQIEDDAHLFDMFEQFALQVKHKSDSFKPDASHVYDIVCVLQNQTHTLTGQVNELTGQVHILTCEVGNLKDEVAYLKSEILKLKNNQESNKI